MFKDFVLVKTPSPSENWKKLTNKKRIELINNELNKKNLDEFEVFKTPDDGQIVFKVLKPIPSNKRGILLLDLEDQLKDNIDKGLTVWFEPVGDKSKLRNLRGIKFQPD
ncbi:MAG: hypothetical protein QF864_00195 [SAR202 cluster bacterium]|jgi:hypothetical protein|nr:hypothetical protein [SAR202 cluster bacterium]|tara:strand:+ start:395 stop:721 length:327 start_codon:yes stop_codon:yes gene_type:complete